LNYYKSIVLEGTEVENGWTSLLTAPV
jgi:hypothetical protein